MLIAPHAATTALLLVAAQATRATAAASNTANAAPKSEYSARHRSEFLSAMNRPSSTGGLPSRQLQEATKSLDMKSFQEALGGNSPRSKRLRKKVLERATPTNEEGRKLQKEHQQSSRRLSDDDDDAAKGQTWNVNFGFDATQYSVSYLRCAEVRQFDDELAATEDTPDVFTTEHFAIFRFCPAQTCNGGYKDNVSYNSAMGYTTNTSNQELLGARGEYCQSNYGEYMLTIEEYLQIMADYHADRFEAYCEYCEECMYLVYQKWMQSMNAGGRDLSEISEAEVWMEELHQNARKLDYTSACPEYETCQYYKNLCKQGIDEDVEAYFECAEAENQYNGMTAYIGPHCSKEDGYTIQLGVYSDAYCNRYVGDYVTAYLGQEYAADPLQEYYHPQEQVCIPCKASDRMYEPMTEEYASANYDENANAYDPDASVNELCEQLYSVSARCDQHYRSYTSKNARSKYYSVEQMKLSCDFIDSVVVGNFDEFGEVLLDNSTLPFGEISYLQNSMLWNDYGHYVTEVKWWQVVGLVASIALCTSMAVWSAKLHDSLRKGWKPKRGSSMGAGSDLNRSESGIHMARSSGSYYMT